ncbi:MAG: glucose-1-phosphate adenylyltransferase [Planctomycetes bacterium]|jgi:glucose-1-phosphate adenylyltransferase|nr:glucose-1-phosphate adenylyltransferase [Planctomycetota bacterium]
MQLNEELRDTLVLVLAGGTGTRLKPLTETRAKPAVPFGGAYRIIDFTLSNCIHSGLRRIYVLSQYRARSLEEHIRFAWNFLPLRLSQFISVRPPHHGGEANWYRGTADAIWQNLDALADEKPKHVVILSGDHIYRMDYGRMLEEHVNNGAALTIGMVKIPVEESCRFGIFECDLTGRVVSFEEKPSRGRELADQPGQCLASMGIYVFETGELIRRLEADAQEPASSHDFGNDIIPQMIEEVPVHAHRFVEPGGGDRTYWRDVGTIEALFEANLDLCAVEPQFNLYRQDWPTYTLWHNDPPAKAVLNADVIDSLMCPGVVVSGARLRRAVLSNRCQVEPGATVEEAVLFSGVVIGEGARVQRAIIDKWTVVPAGVEIGFDVEQDRARFSVSDTGIVTVPSKFAF